VTIYDFSIAPYAQIFLVIHLALLVGLYWLDRSPWLVQLRLERDPARLAMARQLEETIAKQPLAAAPRARMALLYADAGALGVARRYVRQAEKLDPNDSTLKLAQARLAAEQRNPAAADKAAQAALSGDLTPQARAALLTQLASNHMQAGRREQAISAFSEAIALAPENDELYYWRGIVRRSLGRNAEALADFEKAAEVAKDPADQARARREVETTRARL
jgi:tetratricopeptide (TPR) repeat protein